MRLLLLACILALACVGGLVQAGRPPGLCVISGIIP